LKKLLLILSLFISLGLLAGCGSQKDAAGEAKKSADASKKVVVGVTLQNVSEEFIAMLKDAMVLRAKNYPDIDLIINDAESKPDKQASQMDSFISQKVNAIVIDPADADALVPSVEAAVKAGIPVITLSADVSKNVGQFWSGSSNEEAGALQAEWVAKKLNGKGNVAILRGMTGAFAETGRFAGYKKVFDKYPDIKIVFDQSGSWQRDKGMAIMENWIQSGKQIDAVLAQNDAMALGALKAVQDANLKGKILVTGIDAIKDALDSIKAGGLDATCFQDAIGQAFGAVDLAYKAGKGEKIGPNVIPFEVVTKENADKYYDRISLKK